MHAALTLIAVMLLLLALVALAVTPCGVPADSPCSTDTECACLHEED